MSHLSRIRNLLLGLTGLAALAACSLPADVNEPQVPMGDFRLGHNVVVVDEPTIGPFSRTATDEEWTDELTAAINKRFGGYEGEKFYNLGIKVEAYALAMPGVPLVFKPRSVLVVNVLVWDDATQTRLNPEVKQLTIFEGISGETIISSGLTQNKKKQMVKLSNNAAKAIQDYLLENPEWFGLPPLDAVPQGTEAPATDAEALEAMPIEFAPLDSPPPSSEEATN
ncbi:MAG: hypothetical protein WBN04_20600 [Paracoccaceae bacterium]